MANFYDKPIYLSWLFEPGVPRYPQVYYHIYYFPRPPWIVEPSYGPVCVCFITKFVIVASSSLLYM